MKPIIKYRGGKQKEIPDFMNRIPQDYHRYFEPFLGGGAVYFHTEPEQSHSVNVKRVIPPLCLWRRNFCAAEGALFGFSGAIFERLRSPLH